MAKRRAKKRKSGKRRKLYGAAAAARAKKRGKKRARRSNPRRARARARRVTHRRRSNPRRRRARAASAAPRRRRRRANPHHKRARGRRHGFRRRRRNPGAMNPIVKVLLLVGAALGSGIAGNLVANMVAPGSDNARKAVGAAGIAGGVFVARKHPMLGVALAVGSAWAAFGAQLSWKAQMMFASPVDQMKLQSAQKAAMGALSVQGGIHGLTPVAQLQAVLANNLGDVDAVVANEMAAVVANNMSAPDDPFGGGWGMAEYTG